MNLSLYIKNFIIFIFAFLNFENVIGQELNFVPEFSYEYYRKNQLFKGKEENQSLLIRDFSNHELDSLNNNIFSIIPIKSYFVFNSNRPYWYSPMGMIPSRGGQVYFSGGVSISKKYFLFSVQPEFNVSQNSRYSGFSGFGEERLNRRYITYRVRGDYPELFGSGKYSRIGLGQSKIVGKIGSLELGLSSANVWWGPGQWNSLTFSNNAPGFLHGVLGTHRPAKTFFGTLEFQLISGFPKSKKYHPFQIDEINETVEQKPIRDRYLNALNISFSPKWIKGLSIGGARTVQTFTDSVNVNRFIDIFPVFWGLTKESVGSDLVGESDRGRDQQISFFFRYLIPKARFEFYGEFGRRDHALNLRDLLLNPEHSRAYLFGFNKLFILPNGNKLMLRSEVVKQQQSLSWAIRAGSINTWHTNGTIGGFTNWDQAMGVGVGAGSDAQIFEISIFKGFNKYGIYFERIVQNSDFYDVANLNELGYKPWVDFTAGPIFDHQWKNLIFSGRMLFTYASNYYWSQDLGSQAGVDFPVQQNKFSTSTQVNLIYLFNKD